MEFEVKSPILGFENVNTMRLEKVDDIFMRLSNVAEEHPSFTLINPFALREYEFEVPLAIKLLLDLRDDTNLLILNIMIVQKPIENSTVNFIAPLLFNFDNKLMAQVVLDSTRYPKFGLAESISSYMQKNEKSE